MRTKKDWLDKAKHVLGLEQQQFPCFMWHPEKGERLFRTKEELEESGGGWVDSPAKLEVGRHV